MKRISLIICISIATLSLVGAQSVKVNTHKAKGDKSFEQFHYKAAVDHYKRALKGNSNGEVELRLAECHRELNMPKEAEFWYKQAISKGAHLTEDDYLYFAQVLKTNENYDEAIIIYQKYTNRGEWIGKTVAALKNTEKFYQNEDAFQVEWAPFNSTEKDFSPTYYNNKIVFVTNREKSSKTFHWDKSNFLELYQIDGDEAAPFHGSINSSFHEGPSTFFEDGTKMYFSRNNYSKNKLGLSKDGVNKIKIYYTENRKGGSHWSDPIEFPFNSDEYSTGHPSITPDGYTIYFASDMPGGFGGVDIYRSFYRNGVWQTPENLGPSVNTERDEMFPFIHKNNTLYFSSTGHEGLGGLDIFKIQLGEDEDPENMGYPLNTSSDDFGISFYKESNKAYFSSNRTGGMGDDDIYSVFIYDYIVEVTLVDALTGERITADGRIDVLKTLRSQLKDNGTTVPQTYVSFGVEKGTSFFVTGSADGYYQGNLIIQIKEEDFNGIQRLSYEIPLTRLEGDLSAEILVVVNNDAPTQLFYSTDEEYIAFEGSLEQLKKKLPQEGYEIVKETYLTNILYDFDQYQIRSDAAVALNKVIDYLIADDELNIMLESHTDIRGSNQYNQLLAKKRVEAARKYLIGGGIAKDRIFVGSHGEEKTYINCQDCSETQHQMNRRTEIKIEVNKRKSKKQLSAYN